MKSFEYTITDPVGLHARPASLLVKKSKELGVKITIKKDDKEAEATKLMAVMALGVKQNDSVIVTVDSDDDAVVNEVQAFFSENF